MVEVFGNNMDDMSLKVRNQPSRVPIALLMIKLEHGQNRYGTAGASTGLIRGFETIGTDFPLIC